MNRIYLDHNATTPVHPLVAEAMARCYEAACGNPASQHEFGRRARRLLEDAREAIARILGAVPTGPQADRVILTSGGTEANNLALFGLARYQTGNIVISAIEHPSIIGPAQQLRAEGIELRRARASRDGVVDLDHLRSLLDAHTRLVSVMLANGETGVLQPVGSIVRLCAERGIPLHTDAVQVAGKLPVDFRGLGVAALSATAHKLQGPQGIGVLIVRHDVSLRPMMFGGFQQGGFRPGTESVALAVGFRKALELWKEEAEDRAARLAKLRDRLEAQIAASCSEVLLLGSRAPRLPQTSKLSFPGLDRQAMVMALDLAGVACSTGTACASGASEPSPVLLAMGCPKAVVDGAIRVSFGAQTTPSEIDEAARRIIKVIKDLRQKK